MTMKITSRPSHLCFFAPGHMSNILIMMLWKIVHDHRALCNHFKVLQVGRCNLMFPLLHHY